MNNDENSNFTKKQYTQIPYVVNRTILDQESLTEASKYSRRKRSLKSHLVDWSENLNAEKLLFNAVPILKWLPEYSVKENLLGDVMAGISVALQHIPQGMAFGVLAGLNPVVGLYMAVIPTIVFSIFSTSRHISMGTFFVICLVTGNIAASYEKQGFPKNVTSDDFTDELEFRPQYTAYQIATAIAMIVGITHVVSSFLKPGILSALLSDPLRSAFTTGVAVHVVANQAENMLGVTIPRHEGVFKLAYYIRDIYVNFEDTNLVTFIITLSGTMFLLLMNEFISPLLAKKCKIPVPSELIVVLFGAACAYFYDFDKTYEVNLVNSMPSGLPALEIPPLDMLGTVAISVMPIAIVSYSVAMAVSKNYSKKHQYKIRLNQDLFAIGIANITGSFFGCIPLACSSSRSQAQEQSGGKTQMASFVSALIILITLLWATPVLEKLPYACLGAISLVVAITMFKQFADVLKFAKEGFLELIVWLGTFLTVIVTDIPIGLWTGLILSMIAFYVKGWKSYSCMLGVIPETDIYVDIKTHGAAVEIPYTKIVRHCGSINFVTRWSFKNQLMKSIGLTNSVLREAKDNTSHPEKLIQLKTVILDLSGVAHLDRSGCKVLKEIQETLNPLGSDFLLAFPNNGVYNTLEMEETENPGTTNKFMIFPTIHDAVMFSQFKFNKEFHK